MFWFYGKALPICDGSDNLFWTQECKSFSLTHPFWSLRMLMMNTRIAITSSILGQQPQLRLMLQASPVFINCFQKLRVNSFEDWRGFPLAVLGEVCCPFFPWCSSPTPINFKLYNHSRQEASHSLPTALSFDKRNILPILESD